MTLNKSAKVIFASHQEKNDQSRQVISPYPPLNDHKTLNPPFLTPPSPPAEVVALPLCNLVNLSIKQSLYKAPI